MNYERRNGEWVRVYTLRMWTLRHWEWLTFGDDLISRREDTEGFLIGGRLCR